MKILRAYKTELAPNRCQRTQLMKSAGTARAAWNWGLKKRIKAYREEGVTLNAIALHKELNLLKKIPKADGGFPWMYEVSKWCAQEALRNLDRAFANFFRRCKQSEKKKGFPRFKSRSRDGIGSFRLGAPIRATEARIQLPRIGRVKLKEKGYLPTAEGAHIRILSATVSERAGRWFVSLQIEEEIDDPAQPETSKVLGVDVGINKLAVTSDGEVFENPKALKKAKKRERVLSKAVSRKEKGSSNREKAKRKLAKHSYKVSNIRRDAQHKATSAIAKSASVLVLEDLHVKGMLKNHNLARSLSDAALGELLRQLEYKASWHGVTIVKASRWFPSSKMCSSCGHVEESLSLGDRVFRCSSCGLETDRDLNAAINLKNLAVSSTVASPPLKGEEDKACRLGSSGFFDDLSSEKWIKEVKLPIGQESNREASTCM